MHLNLKSQVQKTWIHTDCKVKWLGDMNAEAIHARFWEEAVLSLEESKWSLV
jgi:hypothetical protein